MQSGYHHIIVVDDDSSMIEAIGRLLSVVGFQAEMFPNAESLLESGRATVAACFIFDVQLPGISGFELHRLLKDSGISRPIIFVSAYDHPAAREHARRAGAKGFFSKPFPGRELLAAVVHAIGTP